MKPVCLIKSILVVLLLLVPASVFSQESCNADDQSALEACIVDATDTCEAAYPECTVVAITPEAALSLLAERCGSCDDVKNFGRYNSCLKRVRNGIRTLKALSDEVKDALATARSECKLVKKGGKGKKGGGNHGS